MYPFRNILFPTDFTAHARAALKYAAAFARSGRGRVVLFSVQSASVPANLLTLPEHVFEDHDNRWLFQLRTEVKDLLADPLFDGLEVEPVIVEGESAAEIARAVREYDIDLVTVVTHGRKGLSRALWGSTAEEIIAEAPCPVLTIRPPQHDFVEHRGSHSEIRLNRVLLATNFRPSSAAATHVARQLADRTGAELHALYVIGDYIEQISVMFPEGGLTALSRMRNYVQEKMGQLIRDDGSRTITHVAEGRPYAEIVRLAAENDADLIVIGTSVHASLFGGTPVLGSEIERVVRNAPCPVLCVPPSKVLTPMPALVTQPVPQM
ncbi:MAG TPA: universal stress protein [Pyrinomonadaceae bacterium]|nr:universal stress protein [Pyrinomonadaceae bacterium]